MRDGAEHDQHEQQRREIEGGDQLQQVPERPQSVGADRERHGAERADRRRANDDVDDPEEHLGRDVDRVGDALAELAHPRDG